MIKEGTRIRFKQDAIEKYGDRIYGDGIYTVIQFTQDRFEGRASITNYFGAPETIDFDGHDVVEADSIAERLNTLELENAELKDTVMGLERSVESLNRDAGRLRDDIREILGKLAKLS